MAANTFLELNDTPSSYGSSNNKFLRVNSAGDGVQFWFVNLDDLENVQSTGAYFPTNGQGLIYNAAAGVWRPGTLDVYSAGNGLNKSGLTFNVTAAAGGGLTADTTGVAITSIANVAGTWGSDTTIPVFTVNNKGQVVSIDQVSANVQTAYNLAADYVGNVLGTPGQITVTGGTGNKSNATINLVATGVTAGVYGNTTTVPRITVDTYGRIQNVDVVTISGGTGGAGNTSLAFSAIAVPGQTTISADQAEDTLTLVGGAGISITTNANNDSITFAVNSNVLVGTLSISDLIDVAPITGITNGQILQWSTSNARFEIGSVGTSGNVVSSETAPAFPTEGALWYDQVSGRIYIYYSGAWVDAAPAAAPQTEVDLSAVSQHILPDADSTYDLGNIDLQWRSLYVSNDTIYVGGVPISVGDGDVLTVNDNAVATEEFVNQAVTNVTDVDHLNVEARSEFAAEAVFFEKLPDTDHTVVFDTVDTGLTLSRIAEGLGGNGGGLINTETETEWDQLGPDGTEWNWDGWDNLDNVTVRRYQPLRQVLRQRQGENIVGAELVMHDLINDKYHTVLFSAWGRGAAHDGSFAYTRQLIDTEKQLGVTFADGTTLHSAPDRFKHYPQSFVGSYSLFTLREIDAGGFVYAFGVPIRIPNSAEVDFQIGTEILVVSGPQAVTLQAKTYESGTPATVYNPAGGTTSWQIPARSSATLIKIAEDSWQIIASSYQTVIGSWAVPDDTTATYSFTVPVNGTYVMWVRANIPNGIIVWNATVTVTNSNVPAIGQQFAWNYTDAGSPILLTAIPDQIVGTAGTISNSSSYAGSTSNTFDFEIANTSGAEQTVFYGYTKI
jgi:hypothetical protein